MKYLHEIQLNAESPILDMTESELMDIETLILQNRLARMISRLKKAGFSADFQFRGEIAYNLIQVQAIDLTHAVWATIEECQKLLDIEYNVKNPEKSFSRWLDRVDAHIVRDESMTDVINDMIQSSEKPRHDGAYEMRRVMLDVAAETKREAKSHQFNLAEILTESGLTIYGLSQKIQAVTGEDVKTIHKRLKQWSETGIPPKFEIADRDLRILGYKFEISKA